MKTKFNFLLTTVLLMFLTVMVSKAQQPATLNTAAAGYTYKVFQAPNKNFGYDILRNGKIVYHEFASINPPENSSTGKNFRAATLSGAGNTFAGKGNLAFQKQEHAEKAALLAIEKMKRKESPVLSQDEIRKITAQ